MLKFSFEGNLDELREFANMLTVQQSEKSALPLPLLKKEESESLQKTIEDVVTPVLETAPIDEPNIDVSSAIAKNPCFDPTTGTYFTAFQDMTKALDALADSQRVGDVEALLKVSSIDGTYGGVHSSKWIKVTENAKALLKKQKEPTVTKSPVDPVKQKSLLVAGGREFISKNGKPAMQEVFKEFGVSNLSGLEPTQYAAFAEKIGVTL